MRTTFSSVIVCWFLAVFATTVAQGQKINYRASVYLKVAPDKEAEAVDFGRTVATKLLREYEFRYAHPYFRPFRRHLHRRTRYGVQLHRLDYLRRNSARANPAIVGPWFRR